MALDGPTQSPHAEHAAARMHVLSALVLLLVCGGLCAAVDIGARSRKVARWLDDRAMVDDRAHHRPFVRTRNYGNPFETLFLDELPAAGYSKGGVHFLGSSDIVFCAEFGDLPPAQAALIHNYGFPGANPAEILVFIRYLVDYRGLLQAGGAKTRIVICLTQNDVLDPPGAGRFLPQYIKASGFYGFDFEGNIIPVPMSPWRRALQLRRTQWRSFAQRCAYMLAGGPQSALDPQAFRREAERISAHDWAPRPEQQIKEFAQLLDYLNARGVDTVFLVMPMGTWYEGVPYHEAFLPRTATICAAKHVSVRDCSRLLPDDQFMDAHHANFEGAQKVHEILLDLAREHLRRTGALAAEENALKGKP